MTYKQIEASREARLWSGYYINNSRGETSSFDESREH